VVTAAKTEKLHSRQKRRYGKNNGTRRIRISGEPHTFAGAPQVRAGGLVRVDGVGWSLAVASDGFPRFALPNSPGAQLAFSENGQLLRVIGSGIVTYDAASATIVSNLPLDPNTQIFLIAGNGRTVLLGVRVSPTRIRLLLLDAATGQTQALPSDWYDSDYEVPMRQFRQTDACCPFIRKAIAATGPWLSLSMTG
jgi:hypothetical protein